MALARALARQPRVLLLDEPFSAVDAPARQALYRELAALRQSLSTPMVLVTHDLGEARRLADRVVILDAGEALQTGTPAHVFASPRNARVAELVGIQNHFRGRFHKQEPGWGRLDWGQANGLSLRVLDKNRIADGAAVTWVIAGDHVELLADGQPRENVLRCEMVEQLALGETSLCTLRPQGLAQERVTLNLSTAQLRSLEAGPGRWLRLSIAPEAIHIMPQKSSGHVDGDESQQEHQHAAHDRQHEGHHRHDGFNPVLGLGVVFAVAVAGFGAGHAVSSVGTGADFSKPSEPP